MDDPLINYRTLEVSHYNALESAKNLKNRLGKLQINVVTAESLTSGMIVKTLVDIPGNGATVYGGFSVYDTDAKRKYLGVKTRGVYSHETAKQMASGALMNSRAMVSIAVTGNAMPFPTHKKDLGEVFIGIAVRTNTKPVPIDDGTIHEGKDHFVVTYERNFCGPLGDNVKGGIGIKGLCNAWKELTVSSDDGKNNKYAPYQMTSLIADVIRLNTVSESCNLALNILNKMTIDFNTVKLGIENWDYSTGPSWIIEKHLEKPNPRYQLPISKKTENGHNARNYNQNNKSKTRRQSIIPNSLRSISRHFLTRKKPPAISTRKKPPGTSI